MTATISTATTGADPVTMFERADLLAGKLGTGWVAADGINPAEDREALLTGPNGEVLRMRRLRHVVADPAEWSRIEIGGMAPDELPEGAATRLPRTISVHQSSTPARVAYCVRRWLIPRYVEWLAAERKRDDRPVTATVEHVRKSIPTRVREWAEARGISYKPGIDDGRLILIVGGEPLTPGDAKRRILTPSENPEAYAAFAELADQSWPDRARRAVEAVGPFGVVAAEWVQRWHADRLAAVVGPAAVAVKPCPAPETVPIDEWAEVDGWALAEGHKIEATARLYLTWHDHGWEVDSTSVDGYALDLVGEDERHDNSECDAEDECDPDSHRTAVEAAYRHRIPTGAELIPRIGARILDTYHAKPDSVNADVKRLRDLLLQTVDHELAELGLRVLFGQKFAAPPTSVLTIAPNGDRLVRMPRDDHAVVSGLIAPSSEINHAGIFYPDATHERLTVTFPFESFEDWATEPAAGNTDECPRYFADAGM